MDLEPFVITTPDQAFKIQTILQHMQFKTSSASGVFPIGTIKTGDSVLALDLETDVSG